jgi:hypothetical protein
MTSQRLGCAASQVTALQLMTGFLQRRGQQGHLDAQGHRGKPQRNRHRLFNEPLKLYEMGHQESTEASRMQIWSCFLQKRSEKAVKQYLLVVC